METLARPCCHCGSDDTQDHCFNVMCTWVKCAQCSRLTDASRPAPDEG